MAYIWRDQAITWTNVDLLSVRSCGIHTRDISQELLQIALLVMSLKFTNLRSQPYLHGAKELNQHRPCLRRHCAKLRFKMIIIKAKISRINAHSPSKFTEFLLYIIYTNRDYLYGSIRLDRQWSLWLGWMITSARNRGSNYTPVTPDIPHWLSTGLPEIPRVTLTDI